VGGWVGGSSLYECLVACRKLPEFIWPGQLTLLTASIIKELGLPGGDVASSRVWAFGIAFLRATLTLHGEEEHNLMTQIDRLAYEFTDIIVATKTDFS
jgi:hypothetical protein